MIIKISKKIKFYVPIEQEQLLGIMKYVIISLSAVALILGIVCGILYFRTGRITVEAGTNITAADITGNEGSYFGDDFDADCLNRPGVYYFTVITDGKEQEVCITVVDTKAPAVTVKEINWPQGNRSRDPKPEDFIDTVVEAGELIGEFIEPLPEFDKGSAVYRAKVRFADGAGNKTKIFDVVLRLELDSEAPKIKVLQNTVEIKVGTLSEEMGVDMMSVYYDLVNVTDNCAGDLSLTVDDSGVDYGTPGSYTVYLTATDMVGNKSEKVSVTVLIVDEISESGE
jgi:hypothetical protein